MNSNVYTDKRREREKNDAITYECEFLQMLLMTGSFSQYLGVAHHTKKIELQYEHEQQHRELGRFGR